MADKEKAEDKVTEEESHEEGKGEIQTPHVDDPHIWKGPHQVHVRSHHAAHLQL